MNPKISRMLLGVLRHTFLPVFVSTVVIGVIVGVVLLIKAHPAILVGVILWFVGKFILTVWEG